MEDKQELIKKIEKLEAQLYKAEQESIAWSNGKYKKSSNADISKIQVNSLRDSISKFRQKLESL